MQIRCTLTNVSCVDYLMATNRTQTWLLLTFNFAMALIAPVVLATLYFWVAGIYPSVWFRGVFGLVAGVCLPLLAGVWFLRQCMFGRFVFRVVAVAYFFIGIIVLLNLWLVIDAVWFHSPL